MYYIAIYSLLQWQCWTNGLTAMGWIRLNIWTNKRNQHLNNRFAPASLCGVLVFDSVSRLLRLARLARLARLRPSLSHTIFHRQLFHNHLSHTTLSHTSFHTTVLCHTPSFTHHLSHTALSHTIFRTPSFTHIIFHTQVCHTPSFLHLLLCLSLLPRPRYNISGSLLEEVDLWGYPVLLFLFWRLLMLGFTSLLSVGWIFAWIVFWLVSSSASTSSRWHVLRVCDVCDACCIHSLWCWPRAAPTADTLGTLGVCTPCHQSFDLGGPHVRSLAPNAWWTEPA